MILTYKYRLLPNKRQHTALADVCERQRILYNAALEERIGCYRKTGKGRSYIDQAKALTECRRDVDGMSGLPVNLQRWTLKRLDAAYQGFFSRLKKSGKAGFPRFRSKSRWRSFGFAEFSGIMLKDNRLRFAGIPGGLRVHMHRRLPEGKPLGCSLSKDSKGWTVAFQMNVEAAPKRTVSNPVGIDMGLIAFAYQSDGVAIPAPQVARRTEKEMRRRSRALARCKRGSANRGKVKQRLARLHAKIANKRSTWLHQVSARIANTYDLIIAEDLRVANMVKNGRLARSISDASWTKFLELLAYKAEKAGATFIKVNPKMTSQDCSGCGVTVRKGLSVRVHSCPECGLVLDRDYNAALNILRMGVLAHGGDNVAGYGERSRGNISLEISN